MSGLALDVKSLTIKFGGLTALNDLSLQIPQKSIFGLIGPNGAGKTTAFNLLTGVYKPTSGTISAFGNQIEGMPAWAVTQKGLARTFQNIRLFKSLSVLENLLVAMDANLRWARPGLFSSIIRTRKVLKVETEKTQYAMELLKIFKLADRASVEAQYLPYGDQRRLEILRAMATGAKMILLDEPAAGLLAQETADLLHTLRSIRDQFGLTILLIEHDMKLVMGVCERIAVLDYGVKIAEGNSREIQNNERVIEAYLGKGANKRARH